MTPFPRLIGAHVSSAGGHHKAIERAAAMGCTAAQIFTGSPRIWARRAVTEQEAAVVQEHQKQYGIQKLFIHALYLINLASENPILVEKSVEALKKDMQSCSTLRADGVVVHLGSHQGRGWDAVKSQVIAQIITILEATPDSATFLIEPSAGQNGKLCSDLSEVKELIDAVEPQFGTRIGWCLDTCHTFAAGYYLGLEMPEDSQSSKNIEKATSATTAIDLLGLWKNLRCIHVNDSRDPFASGKDRHENLGDGQIGSAELAQFLSNQNLAQVPCILEVPGIQGEGPDAENVQRLQTLLKNSGKTV